MSKNPKIYNVDMVKVRHADKMRNRLHNLDMSLENNQEIIRQATEEFITLVEGEKFTTYIDSAKKRLLDVDLIWMILAQEQYLIES